jgi:tetratricopeptide (TPR) repeat protein
MDPIQLEILKIDRQWQQEVRQYPDVPLFICLGERHELNLFESYFKYQLSDDSTAEDIFMIHYQPFENPATYGQALLGEWTEIFELWQGEKNTPLQWKTDLTENPRYKTDAFIPVKALLELHQLYPDLKDKKIFVHLAPVAISNLTDFELWVKEWCKAVSGQGNIKLVFSDHQQHRSLKHIRNGHEFNIKIEISQLMQHAAAYTNRQKNDVESDYQQQLLIASNCLSKGKHDQGHVALERAIAIAQKQGLKEPEAAARLMLAQSFAAIRKNKEAHNQYHLALIAAGDNTLIGAQMHMNYGSFLLSQSQKKEARLYFDKAVQVAEAIDNDFIAMECTRLVGQLSESKWAGVSKALPCYLKCIEIGKRMPLDKRRQSSMAYIALTIQKIYGMESKDSKALEMEMEEYIGKDWKTLATMPDE